MKKLPVGIQNFRKLIEGEYIYIDKTQYVYNLINDASYYFLSRPRRFGKSLLLDTIAEAFSGNKELFKGLSIYSSDYSFEKHPVLRLDMSNIVNESSEMLKASLSKALLKYVKKEGFDIPFDMPSEMFKNLIEELYNKYNQTVVVLIDEYDKPILDQLSNIKTAESNRDVLRGFYGVLKSMDPFLRLTFITGITKFTKTTIFSGLNNLRDITLSRKYANICGIAVEDLDKYFSEHIEYLSSLDEFDRFNDIHSEILSWYDGYSWDGKTRVLNPFSLLSFFSEEKFSSFWYSSGTPKFLVDIIKKDPRIYTSLKNLKITELMLDITEINDIETQLLLFQAGYLTVKEIMLTKGSDIYILDMPNFEVREAFNLQMVAAFTEKKQPYVKQAQLEIDEAFAKNDLQKVLEMLRRLFASIPYQLHIDKEAYYQSIFLAVMNVLGFEIDAEVSVSSGRVDAILELDDKVYIFEFKYNECPQNATIEDKQRLFEKSLENGMKQINDRGYAKRYYGCGKEIYLATFAFLGRDDIEMRSERH